MSRPAAPGRVHALATAGWGRAARGGALAFGVVLASALGIALAAGTLGGVGLTPAGALRVGGVYLALFHRIPLRVTAEGSDLWLAAALGAPAGTRALEVGLAAAPLAVTALAAWLLWRAGRSVAEQAGGGPVERALHGAKVGPAYAGLVLLATLPTRAVLAPEALDLRVRLSVPPAPALLLPLALAAAAGAAGGWWSASVGRAIRAAVLGGWTMLVAGLGLSLAGVFVAGVVRPDGPEALLSPTSGRYLRAVIARPSTGLVALAHHVAVLPNEATWTLVPAMGGCTGVYPDGGEATPFLCYGRFPRSVRLPVWLRRPGAEAGPPTRFGEAPWPYLLFLLVPAAAAVLGGRRAAAAAGPGRALPAAIGAGAAFAALVLVVGWAASISLSSRAQVAGGVQQVRSVRLGPDPISGSALALGWGVAGGALGAGITGWRASRRG